MPPSSYTILLETMRGSFMMNRNDRHQPMAIVRSGRAHIDREIELITQISELLPAGAVAIDAGANIGLIAIPLAQAMAPKGGTVLAFEPQRLTFYMLAGNTALAGLENCICHQAALSDAAGIIEVPTPDPWAEQDFGMVSLVDPIGDGDPVQAIAIDDLKLERLDFLKIDVENMEGKVLAGASETVTRCRPLIWIEIWPDHYEEIYGWLRDRDYEVSVVDALNFCAVPSEKKRILPISFVDFDGVSNPYFPTNDGTLEE